MAPIGAEWHYVLLILFIWFSGCTTQEKYDVYPMCPANEDCLTLSTVVNEKDTYFMSNVTLVFHPGDHSLQDEIVSVADVSHLTLQGSTASNSSDALATRIVCDNSSIFYCGVPFLRIHSINFVSCRSVLSFTVARFQDCSFENSTGVNGGAMYVDSASNVMFVGHTVFTGNTAIQTGGAIYTNDSAITFSGEATFAVNHAQSGSGGAVYADENNTLSFSGSSSFEGNTAGYFGGALYANDNNYISFSGNRIFDRNGGAMAAHEKHTSSVTGNSSFMGNTAVTGGALFAKRDNTFTFSGSSSFHTNSAVGFCDGLCECNTLTFRGGGALYAYENNTLTFSGDIVFDNNTALSGGGAFATNINNTLSFSGNSRFEGNTAENNGGALFACECNVLSFNGRSNFVGNTARYSHGGALCAVVENTLSFHGYSNFEGNTADTTGGALSIFTENTLSFSESSSFEGNTARYFGGALYAFKNSTVNFSGSSSFEGNTAEYDGGALYAVVKNILSFSGSSSFEGNTARYFGGALYVSDNNYISFSGNKIFDRNGGAMAAHEKHTSSVTGNSSFMGNTAVTGGALFAKWDNTFTFSGSSSFHTNSAVGFCGELCECNPLTFRGGGALYAYVNNTLTFSGDIGFDNNTALSGGAFATNINNTLSFSGNSRFEGNTAENNGGALFACEYNVLSFNGRSNFVRNTARYSHGGALCAVVENTLSFHGYSNFEGNTADTTGGALSIFTENTLSFNGSSSFDGNTVTFFGGALYAFKNSTVNFRGSSSFDRNTAENGGALHSGGKSVISFSGTNDFRENIAIIGGVLYCSGNETIFSGETLFLSNTARVLGGVIYAVNSVTQLTGKFTFAENKANDGGGICLQGGRITFQGEGSYIDNTAFQDGYGGAILAISSVAAFNGSYQFNTNTAGFGGGMALAGDKDRTLVLEPGTNMSFNGNAAHKRGGTLYVEDNPFTYCIFNTTTITGLEHSCFMQFFDPEEHPCDTAGIPLLDNTTGIHDYVNLTFLDNTATESGSDLYGGSLDSCGICVSDRGYTLHVQGSAIFEQITTVNASSKLEISSDPYRVCICMNNHTQCNQTTINIQKYPGETLSVPLVSVGLMDGPVPSVIRAVSENLTRTSTFKVTQPAESNQFCTELQYPLFSEETNETLTLYSDEPCSTSGFPLTVHITFLPCPVGFTLSDQGNCICEERLQKYTQNCMVEKLSMKREQGDSFWVGLEDASKSGLILHPHCPFDYCAEEAVNFTLNNTDLQCSSGRSGVLCGGCQSGHSLALGSSQCLSGCSNSSLALLLAFAAAGVVLVAFLFLCRLTVAEGTLSGLIFYANVLAVNQSIFFPAGTTNILTVFIAWLNLDLGIETCFFVGLDAYSRTWLQFVFPIYIWVLVGIVIYLADVTTTFARIIGRTNPVAVLATLFLLSYTKLLRTILAAFSFTTLDYPGDESRLVWLYDGNIGYLEHDSKHIILFIVSLLVFLFVFLPYTLLLLCGQWILRKLQLKWLSSTKQLYLKAFLDAYYAPFNDKHCYWTGLLLLLRSFIVLLSTLLNIENPQDPFVSLAVLQGIVSGMLLWAWFTESLYKKWYLNILEASFIFNLMVLIGGTYQIRLSGGNQDALAYTSVTIAFATFIGLVISGVTRQGKNVILRRRTVVQQRRGAVLQLLVNTEGNDSEESEQSPVVTPPSNVTCNVVEIFRHGSQEDIEMKPLVTVPEGNN